MADRDSAKHIPDWDGSSGSTEDEHDRNEKRAEAQRKLESTSPKVNSIKRNQSVKKSQAGDFRPLPTGANPRVLCLDGGGVRGVVQLEVLRGIERALGDYISVQAFFDLIVGTGFGGLLAMSLSLRGQTVEACLEQFKTTCDRAFKSKLKSVPGVKNITSALGGGQRYRPKPLYDALTTAFGENDSLLGSSRRFNQQNRAAVTAAHGIDQKPFLMTNYHNATALSEDPFEDSPTQDEELKIWQAVAAATADPAYYSPFELDGKTYFDAGVSCGNPAALAEQERQLLWPELDEPDLFLSLGTGQNRLEVLQRRTSSSCGSREEEATGAAPIRAMRRMSRRLSSLSTRREAEVHDAEFAWMKLKGQVEQECSEVKATRYIRLNPDLGRAPPAPDSKHEMDSLQATVSKGLKSPQKVTALRNIAHRLVASSFYLDSRSTVTDDQGERVLSGTIACRFKYGSDQVRALGRVLQDRIKDDFVPYFLVKPDAASKYRSKTIKLTPEILTAMVKRGIFALPAMTIPVHDEAKESTLNLFLSPADELEPQGFPISGFPHVLLAKKREQQDAHKHLSSSPMALQKRARAMSDMRLPKPDSTSFASLSRSNSTNAVPANKNKRNTYAAPSFLARGSSKRLSIQDIIAEEREQQAGAFVEPVHHRPSQFWTYIGNRRLEECAEGDETPAPAYTTAPGHGHGHGRTGSVVSDLDVYLNPGKRPDDLWSPLDGGGAGGLGSSVARSRGEMDAV